ATTLKRSKPGLSGKQLPNTRAISAMPPKNWDYHEVLCIAEWKRMVFRNFRFQIILRVILIFAVLSILAWCLVTSLYLRSFYVGAGALILLVELIWYIDRFNRDVKTFMISLQQRDFTTHFQSKGQGQTFDELYGVLNQITA